MFASMAAVARRRAAGPPALLLRARRSPLAVATASAALAAICCAFVAVLPGDLDFLCSGRGAWPASAQRARRRRLLVAQWASPPDAKRVCDWLMPGPGQTSEQKGMEELQERWNREEAENVDKAKRTLQSPNTTIAQKRRGIEELEYWAIRRGGYDAEIVLIGALKHPDLDLAGQAHVSLKKTWESHFNAWVNSALSNAKAMTNFGKIDQAMKVYDKVIFENPVWGEGYHLRARLHNKMGNHTQTLRDLHSALEYCPNNYVTMVELGLTYMDKYQDYDKAEELMNKAGDLCPVLPIKAILGVLYSKAPYLRAKAELDAKFNQVTLEAVPQRLLPEGWIHKFEATERPNQAFLRVGAELEQWFAKVQQLNPTRHQQRKLWGMLVIAWDPDKHARELKSFTTQVHLALKDRRERELMKAGAVEGKMMEVQAPDEYDADAITFLRQIRRDRRLQREKVEAQAEMERSEAAPA
mmetsp:Transcript_67667/g.171753  ORF Transcript_67667/g.171753 Transcript_67667/m.171753 type:complete len:469 (-) Transcript_67667:69-1475(-)